MVGSLRATEAFPLQDRSVDLANCEVATRRIVFRQVQGFVRAELMMAVKVQIKIPAGREVLAGQGAGA
jgi:hypothetical protein